MTCRGHARSARLAFVCPQCGVYPPIGEVRILLPAIPSLAVCCRWCGHHGPLLSFAQAEEWVAV